MNRVFVTMKQSRQSAVLFMAVLCFVTAGLLSATTAKSEPVETTGEPGSSGAIQPRPSLRFPRVAPKACS